MCITDAPGDRTERDDLGCVVSATGCAFPDHTITTCIGALHEEAECVPLEGLTVNLLVVGKRCRRDGGVFVGSRLEINRPTPIRMELFSRPCVCRAPMLPLSDLLPVTLRIMSEASWGVLFA